jgi:hypothetical protein
MAFDIREQTDRASAITPDTVELATFRDQPLAPQTVRCLRYLRDVEQYTIRHLRDLLVTPSHTDPVVTEFLTGWAFQEYWLGVTLDAVIAQHWHTPPTAPESLARRALQEVRDRFAPVRQALLANLIGEDFVAIHMAWACLDAAVTESAYRHTASRAGHPILSALTERISELKQTHRQFYADQAFDRLAASHRARTLSRRALTYLWRPPGAAIHTRTETTGVLSYLFEGGEPRALDKTLDTLPGLNGLRIVSSAMATFGVIRT